MPTKFLAAAALLAVVATPALAGTRCIELMGEVHSAVLDKDHRREPPFAEADRVCAAEAITDAAERAKMPAPFIGMSLAVVKATSWGLPIDVHRTTLASREVVEVIFNGQRALYFVNGVLSAIQQ